MKEDKMMSERKVNSRKEASLFFFVFLFSILFCFVHVTLQFADGYCTRHMYRNCNFPRDTRASIGDTLYIYFFVSIHYQVFKKDGARQDYYKRNSTHSLQPYAQRDMKYT